ncbi:MAG: S-layer homology domain-containing protein [Clostridia bacterium]|nr:S-layer homology domain-containing protein [Clostridia bacterium]
MFKGTNKIAKVLALALALCMLPMAAFAEAPTAKTVAITTTADAAAAAYEAGEAIEIAGTTTSGTVTMLAVRDADEVAEGALTTEFDFTKVVYAGQKAASEGAFSFKFFPKADVAGAMITVFVGGEGVSDLATLSFSVAEPAPAMAAEWYKGEDLTITLSRVTDPTAQAAWWAAVDSFKIGETEISKDDVTIVDNTTITFTAAYLAGKSITSITSITAVDNDGIYNTAKATGLSLPAPKPAGAITVTYPAEKDYYIAGADVGVAVANSSDFGSDWLAALQDRTAVVEVNGVETEYLYYPYLYITFTTFADDFEEGSYTIVIKVDDYEDTTATIAFKASAPLDAPSVAAPVDAFMNAWMDAAPEVADKDELYGKYAVELPATGENGSTITWSVKVDEAEYVAASGTYELVRPATDGADSASYTFKALVSGVGKDVEVGPFPAIEVNKYGTPVHGHGAPSITGVAITPAPEADNVVAGIALTAATEGFYDNKGYADASTFTWTVEGKDPVAGATFTPEVADIGKTVTVTATPKVEPTDGETENLVGTPVSKTVTIILDPTYVPTLEVAIAGGKVTAGSTAKANATYDLTYAADAEFATEYTWYLVPADAVASADDKEAEAIAKVVAEDGAVTVVADGAYEKTAAKNYAVVKGVATYTIAGQAHGTQPVAYAAVLISAKGGSAGGGATLPGAQKPADPTPVEPSEPTEPSEPAEDPVSGDPIANGAAAFTDVDKAKYDWAYEGIDALAKAGVFKGMTPTTFGPELTTTNAQVIALAVRIAGLKADGATTNLVAGDHWVYAEMAAAEKAGILGIFGGKVATEESTTREVAFTLLYNALKAAGVVLPETAEAIEYTDASSIDAACVEAITALTKAGIVNGMGDGTLAPKATITRAQLAKILGIAQTLIK